MKKKRISSHFHQFFKIQTHYKTISPNISVEKKTSTTSKQPEKYIQTTYAHSKYIFAQKKISEQKKNTLTKKNATYSQQNRNMFEHSNLSHVLILHKKKKNQGRGVTPRQIQLVILMTGRNLYRRSRE